MDARGKVAGEALSLTQFWSPLPGTAMDLAVGCEALTVGLLMHIWDPGDLGREQFCLQAYLVRVSEPMGVKAERVEATYLGGCDGFCSKGKEK